VSSKPRFILSDLHLGDGRQSKLEDFDQHASAQFTRFFDAVAKLGGAKVILNGDVIDFPQIHLDTMSTPPQRFLGTTEAESTLRLQKVLAGHPDECNALKKFLTGKDNELVLIPGNHDIDFAWNRVLQTFMQRIGATARNFKFGMVYKEGGVYITHGHQYSDDNQIDVPVNFTFNRLNSCWGTYFVEKFFNQVEERYPLLDNVRPMWKTVLSAILHDEVLVTGQFVAEFLMFLKNFRLPLQDYIRSALFGWKPKTRSLRSRDIDALTTNIPLTTLRDKVAVLRENPAFRQQFDTVFHELSESQWEQVFSPHYSADVLDFVEQPGARPQSRSLFAEGDNYQQAAQCIARHHVGTRVVVMGHTHEAINDKELTIAGTPQTLRYFNTGTWTKTWNIPWWQLPNLKKFYDAKNFTQQAGVVRWTGAGDRLDIGYFEHWQEAL